MYTRPTTLHQEFNPVQATQDFAPFRAYLPPELLEDIQIPPFIYNLNHMFMPEEAHESIALWIPDHDARNREYQELMHTYLHLSAVRMADISPCYMDIWRSYIPSLALGPKGFLPLLGAMCALAALHMTSSQVDGYEARAMVHYHTAVSNLKLEKNLFPIDDAVLATVLILAHYEVPTPLKLVLTVVMEWANYADGIAYERFSANHPSPWKRSFSDSSRKSTICVFSSNRLRILSRNRKSSLPR